MTLDDMIPKRSRRSLTVYLELDSFRDEIKDLPVNKKLREILINLSELFRDRHLKQEAEESAKYWQDSEWKKLMAIRKLLEKKRKKENEKM